MSSDEADRKSVDEDTKDISSGEESEKDVKEEKNSKPAPKKKGADPPKIKQPAKKRVKTEQAEKETKKEDKKEDKKKVEEEDDDDDEESAEENDVENHKAVPLLDQPLEISGSRRRKEVQRFAFKETEGETKEVKIPEGKGKLLGEIEWIDHNITRARPEDLKLLHRICFGKPTKAALVKKNLKKFNGFDFEEASDDYEKKKVQFGSTNKKVTVKNLKSICHMLDVEQKGSKDEIVDRILSFLTCPKDSERKVASGRSQRKGASKKNYDEGADETHKTKKKSPKAKKKSEESEESEKEKSEDEGEDDEEKDEVKTNNKEKNNEESEEEKNDEEEEEEEEEEKPKKGAKNKKTKKAAEVAEKKAPPKKRAAAKKAAEKKVESEEDGDAEEEDEDDEPVAKKTKTPPTDEEIKAYVKSLLEGANLELVTMKKVCQDVYAHYPDHDLGHKKAFIKATVKSLISS